MRIGLTIVICFAASILWYSWFFRYQPLQNSMLLDHWRGEVLNIQTGGAVFSLEQFRLSALERAKKERLLQIEREKTPPKPGTPHTVTPQEHIEYLRQMLLEGQ